MTNPPHKCFKKIKSIFRRLFSYPDVLENDRYHSLEARVERLESVLWGDETRRKEVEEADGGMREAGGAPVPRWAQSFAKFVFACLVVKNKIVVPCLSTSP